MRLWRILAIATTVELAVAAAFMGLAGLAGRWSDWLDLANIVAPLSLAAAALATTGAFLSIPSGRLRTATVTLCVLAMGCGLARVGPEIFSGRPRPTVPAETPHLTLMTFNVWKGNVDRPATISEIVKSGADIVAVQERQARFGGFPEEITRAYPYRSRCGGRARDLTVFTRRLILATGCLGSDGDTVATAAWVRTMAPDGRPVTVLTTHFTWPIPPGEQRRESAAIAGLTRRLPQSELIVTGDFNTAPWTFAMERQDKAFAPLTRRTLALATWPAVAPILHWGPMLPILPIDHIYAAQGWRTVAVRRGASAGSDHYPIITVLARP